MNPKPWLALTLLCSIPAAAAPLQLHGRVVFTRASKRVAAAPEVWTMKPDGTDQKRVWQVPKGYGYFGGFSVDGTKAISLNNFNVYVHDLRTKRFKDVLVWSGGWGTFIVQPTFSPDGKQLLCEVGSWAMNQSNFQVRRLECPRGSIFPTLERPFKPAVEEGSSITQWSSPQWIDGGKRILAVGSHYYSSADSQDLSNHPMASAQIWKMNPDGSDAQRLDFRNGFAGNSNWSHDGQKIATVRAAPVEEGTDPSMAWDLWLTDPSGQTQTQLTFHDQAARKDITVLDRSYVQNPLFSPDDRQIMFEQNGIHCIDVDGKNEHEVVKDGYLMQWIK